LTGESTGEMHNPTVEDMEMFNLTSGIEKMKVNKNGSNN